VKPSFESTLQVGPSPSASPGPTVTIVVGRFCAVIREGLLRILAGDRGLYVAAADLDHAALELAVTRHAAQVAILDEASVVMGDLLARLSAVGPTLGVLVVAHRPKVARGVDLFALGATACVSAEASAAEIVGSVRLVGESVVAVAASERPSAAPQPTGAEWRLALLSLTPRERSVARLLALGWRNTEIALELQISPETARVHVKRIFRKLAVKSRTELGGILLGDTPRATAGPHQE
jgi:DNA-binding NarL/FixJ family response regulator